MFKQAGQGLHVLRTRLGPIGLAWTPRGISRLEIGHATSDETLAANPVPVIVPCHRCLGTDGSLTGFSAAGGTYPQGPAAARRGICA